MQKLSKPKNNSVILLKQIKIKKNNKMINPTFLNILNEIKEKEYSFRDIILTEWENRKGKFSASGSDLENMHLYGPVIGFLIYLKYKSIIPLDDVKNKVELSQALSLSKHKNATEILGIWNEIENHYPYLEKLLSLLSKYDFSPYQEKEQELELAHWCNDNYLFEEGHFVGALNPFENLTCLNVVFDCQKQLGVDVETGNLLVIHAGEEIIKFILKKNISNKNIVFLESERRNISFRINALLLDCYSNVKISDEGGLYDCVIVDDWFRTDSANLESYLELVKAGGCVLAMNIEKSNFSASKAFCANEIPLMFDTCRISVLCRKTEDKSNIVRYGCYQILNEFDLFSEKDEWINKFTECVKNNISTDFYQILTKTDFEVSKEIDFHKVRRLPDQVNFVWRKKEDIFTIDDDGEWLYDTKISDDKIIHTLSENPFVVKAKNDFYLDKSIYQPKGKHILEDCLIIKDNSSWYNYEIKGESVELFEQCYYSSGDRSDELKEFDRALCCRVLTHSGILYSRHGTVLKVDATPDKPVCYDKYFFYFDDLQMDVWCSSCIDIIKINPEYDENFIIYQLLNEKNKFSKYILVAPTKEEQHTYFINKRLDYLSKYQPVVDEIEDEVQRSVSESPAYITGLGFTNFRRFTNLPLLPLAGVNILVGGNNAGKSSFVKGLLLNFDNIKNMTIGNTDNIISTRFQYDANSFHDVHIGTFNRAYSNNAKEESIDGIGRRTMSFSLSFAHFELRLLVAPANNEDTTSVPISQIIIVDHKRNAHFLFDLENLKTKASFIIGGEIVEYEQMGLGFRHTKYGEHKIVSLLRNLVSTKGNPLSFLVDEEQVRNIQSKAGFILEIADELEQIINNTTIEYIYAHGVNQKVLFNYNDKNDYMAQTLHDYMIEKVGDVEREFIRKWLEEFGIGTDLDVHSIGGEAYIIQIKDKSGKMVYLADMGMGANQLVILLLRLAIIIHKQRMSGNKLYRPTIVIEEPEQNMHPEYQSKLATLFHEIHEAYGFNFIVETHSEYLVRRSQVIVAHKKYKDDEELKANNPFKVYYFPTDGNPYEMQYRKDGNFSNEFGKGFYDEANNLLFEII